MHKYSDKSWLYEVRYSLLHPLMLSEVGGISTPQALDPYVHKGILQVHIGYVCLTYCTNKGREIRYRESDLAPRFICEYAFAFLGMGLINVVSLLYYGIYPPRGSAHRCTFLCLSWLLCRGTGAWK